MPIKIVLNDRIKTTRNINIIAISCVVPIFPDNQKTTVRLYITPHNAEYLITSLSNFCSESTFKNGTRLNQHIKPKPRGCCERPVKKADIKTNK